MKSMTGFASKQCDINNRKITIEIKTLNSKSLDIISKIPALLHPYDIEIRSMMGRLERGKVEIIIAEESEKSGCNHINKNLVAERYQELSEIAQTLNCPSANILETIIGMPDIWENKNNDSLSDEEWHTISTAIRETVEEVDNTREHEGEIMKVDIVRHLDTIEQKLGEIPAFEGERIETAKVRIRKYLAECPAKEIDQNRFEQELIYYLEKLDITEEKIRLQKHIDYFRQTMDTETCCGKKLGFITQEMGREINTTGSKANHVEIQKIVVQMKDELEKIKEQLGNIL